MRLDQFLVQHSYFETRARARDAVLRNTVFIDGTPAKKPSQKVLEGHKVSIDDPAVHYVSRAALKLLKALEEFSLSPDDKICLDIGASTGGFTQVLLEKHAKVVHAIDVGHDQLAPRIAKNRRVIRKDGLNARALTLDDLEGQVPQFLVSDVSFISLKLALPPALELAEDGALGVFLVKPQFEAGRDRLGRGGLVAPGIAEQIAQELQDWMNEQPNWSVIGVTSSPIKGGDGNSEYLMACRKQLS
ncbi:TlyA family RNA methyltransferase [Pseudovibrio sp. Tun.PSC04-5.I4]|uniref:TlyA family RNA methyltransferase n=1 Tax=Pseudovibrio sp. Tun.PSC04-5.I4 TaxID=1798213 RepID=UPI00088DBA5E|nr:TlyA family RNA methyltransferase [Pseudovibrio sp. Tun.PSC04-5.I4]SDQ82079.1 23S rRNA (cytidine1920-2'-O)/16S rRNA (cytidine1409-2'-O)-methyltransferase [Pseudovibrio sp. Tun.PSC04-5.I4]